jgi:hypothetical protein
MKLESGKQILVDWFMTRDEIKRCERGHTFNRISIGDGMCLPKTGPEFSVADC